MQVKLTSKAGNDRSKEGSPVGLKPIGWRTALIALGACLLWGGNVVALKLGLETFPPFWSGFWRMFVGALTVGVWAWARGRSLLPGREEWRPLVILSVLFTIQITMLNFGVDFTSPAYGIVLLNAHPIFANFIAHFFVPEDRLSPRRVIGLAAAFAGICVVFLGRPDSSLAAYPIWGNILVTLSALLLGIRIVYTQRLVQTIDPIRPVFWQMVLCLPPFLAAAAIWEQPATQAVGGQAVAAILYQGMIIAGLCFLVWTTLLQHHSPGSLSMFGFTSPIFGIVFSSLFFDEALTARLWLGLAAVTAGIVLVTKRKRSPLINPAAPAPRGAVR